MTQREKLFLAEECERTRRVCKLFDNSNSTYMQEKSRHEFLLLTHLISELVPDLEEQCSLMETVSDKLKDYLPEYA